MGQRMIKLEKIFFSFYSLLILLKQVKGTWQAKKENMMELCKEVKKLQENFISFEVNHVRRVLYILSLLVHCWLNKSSVLVS
jgi:hypothetical protein